jgi:DNA-binding response OmpR family regulator
MNVKLLVVDSNPGDAAAIVKDLRTSGYEPVLVDSLRKAREALETQYYDVVILDSTIINGDGLRLCNEIRMHWGWRMVIIFVSSSGTVSDRVVGLQVGADDFISKPPNAEELIARIEACLRRKLGNMQS